VSLVAFVACRDQYLGKSLVVIGLVIAGFGVLIMLGFPIGRLPGDFAVRRGNFSFYFPLATSIVLSLLLTLLLALFRR
jgi:predicted MFS family arabinose efflux permease